MAPPLQYIDLTRINCTFILFYCCLLFPVHSSVSLLYLLLSAVILRRRRDGSMVHCLREVLELVTASLEIVRLGKRHPRDVSYARSRGVSMCHRLSDHYPYGSAGYHTQLSLFLSSSTGRHQPILGNRLLLLTLLLKCS